MKDRSTLPFDVEQYLLFNTAMEATVDPAFTQSTIEIDYIRIYQDVPTQVTAAPTPVHNEISNNVISIFSDAYSNVNDYAPMWSQTTDATIEDIDRNTTLKYSNLDYQGTEYTTQDVSNLTHIHLDLWTADATVLDFYLISQTPTVDTDLYFLSTTNKEQWISVDIPLTSFPSVDLADVFQFKVVGNGTVYFDNLYFYNNAVVPVELSYFKAEKRESNNVLLWETLSELNNSHFEIQGSNDGINFENIGYVQGNGTDLEINEYEFIDKNSLINSSYRLNQVDFDGRNVYSNILNIERGIIRNVDVSFFPIPIKDNLTITFESAINDKYYLTITSTNGSSVHREWLTINTGKNNFKVDFKDISKGVYVVQLRADKDVIRHQIIKD